MFAYIYILRYHYIVIRSFIEGCSCAGKSLPCVLNLKVITLTECCTFTNRQMRIKMKPTHPVILFTIVNMG